VSLAIKHAILMYRMLCFLAYMYDPHMQIWGLAIGLIDQRATTGWHHMGDGIELWRVRLAHCHA
jgi:hypothetical protein